MGFKDDVREKAIELDERVTRLETQVAHLRRGNGAVTVETPLPTRTPGVSLGVDYGAIAFGLVTMKADVNGIRNSGTNTSTAEVNRYYGGVVQYFADVLAKSDPGFNEAEFKRQAGV